MFNTPDEIGAIDVRARGAKSGVCPLDASALVPLENLPATLTGKDADTVDGLHAAASATANKLLALNSSSKLPASITGDADTLDGKHATDLPGALVWDKLVSGSAVISVTTDGEVTLDGNAHGGYSVEFIIYNPGTATTYRLYYNNDTTNVNYYTIRPGVANVNDAYLTFNGGTQANLVTGFWNGTTQISPAGLIRSDLVFWETSFFGTPMSHHKIATVANLTRIDIVSSVASGIGINSRFRLWRRI